MSNNKIYANCPYFKLGLCHSYKEKNCKYFYHKPCIDNYLCRDDNCKYGHGISIMKRTIITNMYDLIPNYDYDKNNYYNYNCDKINCINEDCEQEHYFSYENRCFIYKIANQYVSDEQAWQLYETKYYAKSPVPSEVMSSNDTIPADSPIISRTMSSNDTIPADSPCPIATTPPPALTATYSSLFKDEIGVMTETMINIRKELAYNTKQSDNIKEQIRKLENDLVISENKIQKNKKQLKDLASKIADC